MAKEDKKQKKQKEEVEEEEEEVVKKDKKKDKKEKKDKKKKKADSDDEAEDEVVKSNGDVPTGPAPAYAQPLVEGDKLETILKYVAKSKCDLGVLY